MTDKLKVFWTKLNSDIGELWQNSKVFVLIFGILIIALQFRNILINFLVANAKSIFNNATQQSTADQKQENKDNQAANSLADQANNLPNSETPVTDDWYTKK